MIYRVELPSRAKKDLERVPRHVLNKMNVWVASVERIGLERVRVLPGFHDEPLHGQRSGQRSIRLNRVWRAIYEIAPWGPCSCASVVEVTHHGY